MIRNWRSTAIIPPPEKGCGKLLPGVVRWIGVAIQQDGSTAQSCCPEMKSASTPTGRLALACA